MTTEIVDAKTGEVLEQKSGFSPEQVQLIKNTICKGATNDELALFMHVCQKSGLDPFSRQIYAIRRRAGNNDVMTFQVSIDGYRAIAERTGNYAPGAEPKYEYSEDGKLKSATVTIKKRVGGEWFDVSATAHYDEFVPKWWDSKKGIWVTSNAMWDKMPHVMLAKCAESAVLRRAFPNELSGTYSTEEMEQAAPPRPEIKMPQPVAQNAKRD